ncbi:MAG: OmpA family protein [Paludibacteraceae bacterium]|nr:OmpA family protein [Paludibacteraceae bacterium]
MKTIKQIISVALLVLLCATASAQQPNTLYFLEDAPTRHYLNPAFQPTSDGYLLFTPIGWTSFGAVNNSIAMSDIIYPNTLGQTATFLHPNATPNGNGVQQFYDKLRKSIISQSDWQINLLSFGFRADQNYIHITINERFDLATAVNKEAFAFLLPNSGNTTYNLGKTQFNARLYTEVAFGFARNINEHWDIGFKLKYLYGSAQLAAFTDDLKFKMGYDEWNINGTGTLLTAGPFGFEDEEQFIREAAPLIFTEDGVKTNFQPFNGSYFKPKGHGAALDFGLSYQPIKNIRISLAVADLGVIRWNKGYKYDMNVDSHYNGAGEIKYSDIAYLNEDGERTFDFQQIADTLKTTFNTIVNDLEGNDATQGYWDMITAKINAGVDFNFWDNRVGFGVFSQTKFYRKNIYEEVTLGLAFRPVSWFNLAASYSFMNGRWSSIGAGLILRAGPIGLTATADYIPLVFTEKMPFTDSFGLAMPYKSQGLNLGLGISLQFGWKHDKDRDKVKDKDDLCPDTPRKVKVDKNGCPTDSDGDGVPDYLDKCPNTSEHAYGLVNEEGCPLDSDADGVADYLDRCPNTPANTPVDSLGCELDEDKDGVPDNLDRCPGTPRGIVVGADGCPLDSDGDGVLDPYDLCPNTPREAIGTVDANGCPRDDDQDGVPNYQDKCPNTPLAVGEKQRKDMTKYVDLVGCEIDTDGDGVPDWRDRCLVVQGVESNDGCPELTQEVRTLFQQALNGIEFETGSSRILPKSYSILDEIAKQIISNTAWNVEIQGHTDNVGNAEYNQRLSQQRAESVKQYLIKKGADENRMTAVGFGQTEPVADNSTAAGRAKNRRVVFNVTFEEITYETIKM